MNPYSLLSVGASGTYSDSSTMNASGSTLAWMVQPNQLTSGNISGSTDISLNGQGVVLAGSQGSIVVSSQGSLVINNPGTSDPVISLLGSKGYILIGNPNTGINQIIIGALPDGTYGMVVSQPGVDVLTLF